MSIFLFFYMIFGGGWGGGGESKMLGPGELVGITYHAGEETPVY